MGSDRLRLKGAALRVLFPRFWDANKLVKALLPVPAHGAHVSSDEHYHRFIMYDLRQLLRSDDVATVAPWLVSTISPTHGRVPDYGELPAALLTLGWKHLPDKATAEALADLIIRFAALHASVWHGSERPRHRNLTPRKQLERALLTDTQRRRALVEQILRRQPGEREELGLAREFYRRDLWHALEFTPVTNDDFEWLAEITPTLSHGGRVLASWWMRKALNDVRFAKSSHVGLFIETIRSIGDEDFDAAFIAAHPVSNGAKYTPETSPRPTRPPLSERVDPLTEKVKAADPQALYRLVNQIGPEVADPQWSQWEREWAASCSATRAAVLDALEAYFCQRTPSPGECRSEWTGEEHCEGLVFRWLVIHRPEPPTWDEAIWNRWLETTLLVPPGCFPKGFTRIVRGIHAQNVKKVIVSACRTWLDSEREAEAESGARGLRLPYLDEELESLVADALAEIALEYLRSSRLSQDAEDWCLSAAVREPPTQLADWLADSIVADALADQESPEHSRMTGRLAALIEVNPERAWPFIESRLMPYDGAFERFLGEVGTKTRFLGKWSRQLTLAQIERILYCVADQTPLPSEHTSYPDPRYVTWQFHQACAEHAIKTGSREAVAMFRRLARQQLPHYTMADRHLREAEEAWLRQTWRGKQSSDMNRMLEQQDARTIDSARELFDWLIELFEEIDGSMRGEHSVVELLWERDANGNRKPKREPEFQAFLKNQITLRAQNWPVVADREVQIGPLGDSDFLVTAVTSTKQTVKVVVEVKLEDNKDLFNAMETQLIGQYMQDPYIHYGIYLVGRYACPVWRPQREDKWQETADRLEKQAQELRSKYPDIVDGLVVCKFDCRLPSTVVKQTLGRRGRRKR